MTTIAAALIALTLPVLAEDAPKPDAAVEAKAAAAAKPDEPAKPVPAELPPAKAEEKKEEPKKEAPQPKPSAAMEEVKKALEEAKGAEALPAKKAELAEETKKLAETSGKRRFKKREAAAEWAFLKDAGSQLEIAEAVPQALQVFVRQNIDDPDAVDAKFLEAQLREKYGDYKTALIDYLRVIHENPTSALAVQAKSAFLALADKKLPRKFKPALGELVKPATKGSKAERMASMLAKISASFADAAYEPTLIEFNKFQIRFPDYESMDDVVYSLAWLHERNGFHAGALLEFKRLTAAYSDSEWVPKAYMAMGQIYAEDLKDYQKAVAAYQALAKMYDGAPQALGALEKTAALFSEKLRQYELAVDIHEKIVENYPKTPSALKALRDASDLLRNRLSRPADAVAALKKIPDHAGQADAVSALEDAAQIARKDLKDYKLEIELRRRVAADYATSKDAADQLLAAGDVASDDLKDAAQASAIYRELQTKYGDSKQAKKAADRIAKLEKR